MRIWIRKWSKHKRHARRSGNYLAYCMSMEGRYTKMITAWNGTDKPNAQKLQIDSK